MIGIYGIRHLATGTIYVGQAQDIEFRWEQHRQYLRLTRHHNAYLQQAWNKYGQEAFEFVVIEECERNSLTEREQFWLDHFREMSTVFNYGPCVTPPNRGVPESIKQRQQHSRTMKGRSHPQTIETRLKISRARKGMKFSSEHCANMSAAVMGKGHPQSPETRVKISATRMRLRAAGLLEIKGHPQTMATRQKISEGHKRRLGKM
jgi:group I intron endonuclease